MMVIARWLACGIACAVFAVRVAIPAARNPNTNGFVAYYTEARTLLENRADLPRVHDDSWFQPRIDQLFGHHVLDVVLGQPPPMSFIMAPVAWLDPGPARAVWTALTLSLWVAGLAILVGTLRIKTRGIPALVVVASLTTLYTPLTDNLRRGQAYVLLFFLLCLTIRSLVAAPGRRQWAGGVPLGLMAVLKAAGLWLWPLFLATRRWRIVLAGLATIAVVILATSPLLGWAMWRTYVLDARWLASNPGQRVTAYQTVISLTGHLFVLDATWNPQPVAHLPRLAQILALSITAAALVGSIRLQRISAVDLDSRALSVALFVSLMVTLAPLAEGYHYVLVFPALMIAFWWALRCGHRSADMTIVIVCAALLATPQSYYGSPRLQAGWAALLAYPRVYGAFGLWAWLGFSLRRLAARPPPALDVPAAVT